MLTSETGRRCCRGGGDRSFSTSTDRGAAGAALGDGGRSDAPSGAGWQRRAARDAAVDRGTAQGRLEIRVAPEGMGDEVQLDIRGDDLRRAAAAALDSAEQRRLGVSLRASERR